ncbi:mitogen-activated protein kinase kinase kinase 16 [Striga hermonthica]|uniref:Mitogen-activated protein kinase kinase kinase 16 n=1 Tax=Striga hermonthica TaxID=68872 RepID=A0A9N7RLU5_STRHE|nr:mitogen-activated protein kinase kinase kinase 16 [Striga hermonthica]
MSASNVLFEYVSGRSLHHRIQRSGGRGLPEMEVRKHARSIPRGLDHIHKLGFVHCDLKPENILLCEKGPFVAKIGDFGLAKEAFSSPETRGTLMYMSPEAVCRNTQEVPSDVCSVACVVLEMLTGKPPWDETSEQEIVAGIVAQRLPKIPKETISGHARNFLEQCFEWNTFFKGSVESVLYHPFLGGLGEDD